MQYPTFDEIEEARLTRLKPLLTAVLQEYNPRLRLTAGTVHDLVLWPRTLLTAAAEQAVDRLLAATSLSDLASGAATAAPADVDRVLGNYRLTRREAASAAGEVAVVLSAARAFSVASGSTFTAGGQTFAADRGYAVRLDANAVLTEADRLLTTVGDGTYRVTIPVTAVAAGAAGNVRRGVTVTPAVLPTAFVRAYAEADFAGGRDQESNESLLARQAAGMSARGWSSRASVEGTIRAAADDAGDLLFPDLKAVSVVGFLDAEMVRDSHSLFPVSAGGRVDLYARTAALFETVTVDRTATLYSKVGAVGTWQVSLGRDDAPGFYEVVRVVLPGLDPNSGGFAVTHDVRGVDVSGGDWAPDIPEAVEGVYSRYQTGVFRFADTVTDASGLTAGVSTKSYTLVVRVLPQVDDLQGFWNDVTRRPTGGDVLVKAPVPCFVAAAMTLNMRRGSTVTAAAVQSALAAAVGDGGFAASLPASTLTQAAYAAAGADLRGVAALSMTGRLRKPDGTEVALSSSSALTVADDPALMTGARTVSFFAAPTDFTVTLTPVD